MEKLKLSQLLAKQEKPLFMHKEQPLVRKQKRKFIFNSITLSGLLFFLKSPFSMAANTMKTANKFPWPKTLAVPVVNLSDKEWKARLSPKAYSVLRKEGTERPGSSPLDKEYSAGEYLCAGCGLLLFTSKMKYDSGTGWPSFTTAVKDHVETKRDFKLLIPRTEYHCKRCGGHQGHLFKDGPKPTRQRWCNNGVALHFVKAEQKS